MTPDLYMAMGAAIIVPALFIAGWVVLSVKFGPFPLLAVMPRMPPIPPVPPPPPWTTRSDFSDLNAWLIAWEQTKDFCPTCGEARK